MNIKKLFTQYWDYLIISTACKLNLFDLLKNSPMTTEDICNKLKLEKKVLKDFLLSLQELGFLSYTDGIWKITDIAEVLTENHPNSYKNACILWSEEHLIAWQNLIITLKTGKPAFEIKFKQNFFDYLKKFPEKFQNYHLAMAEYARDDYKKIPEKINFTPFKTIADIGGGLAILANYIAEKFPQKKIICFDEPEVINIVNKSKINKNVELVPGNFFAPIPFKSDAIILARVLHDWNDSKAITILKNCYNSLNVKGKLFIIESLQDKIPTPTLSINMHLICGSFERTSQEYEQLLVKSNLKLLEIKHYKEHLFILEAKK